LGRTLFVIACTVGFSIGLGYVLLQSIHAGYAQLTFITVFVGMTAMYYGVTTPEERARGVQEIKSSFRRHT
tara:strand:+ start:755 stop:967 length:213 start_codon:yes stop_codon:yes gene_type:complete